MAFFIDAVNGANGYDESVTVRMMCVK